MSYDRRPKFRRAVYARRPGMTDGCRVLLLRLLDDMNSKGIVSVPRSRLATELGVPPARVSERIRLARQLGFLDTVRRARPRVTAVYAATIPPDWEVRISTPLRGTDAVPLNPPSEVQIDPTQVGNAERESASPAPVEHHDEERSDEKCLPSPARSLRSVPA